MKTYWLIMIKSKSSSCFKKLSNRWFCVIGGFILLLSFSADFSYPNINTYLTSYMRNNATNGYNNDLTYDDWVFLTTTKVVVQGGSMPFIGVLCRKIGCRMSIFIGSAIYSIGFMLTYFTVQSYSTKGCQIRTSIQTRVIDLHIWWLITGG